MLCCFTLLTSVTFVLFRFDWLLLFTALLAKLGVGGGWRMGSLCRTKYVLQVETWNPGRDRWKRLGIGWWVWKIMRWWEWCWGRGGHVGILAVADLHGTGRQRSESPWNASSGVTTYKVCVFFLCFHIFPCLRFTCGSLCWCLESGNCVKPKNAFCILPLTEEAFLGSIFSRELRSIPFNNVKALLDFTFISIAQCFCFLKQKFQFLCEAICKTASTNRAYHN